jgi:hypothetical protein
MRGYVLALALACAACAPAPFRYVDGALDDAPTAASPLAAMDDDPAIDSAEAWTQRRAPLLRQAFQDWIYGPLPPPAEPRVLQRGAVTIPALADLMTVEQWTIAVTPDPDPLRFNLVLALPAAGPAPVVLAQVFCGNRAAMPGRPDVVAEPLTPVMYPCRAGWTDPLLQAAFGRYINGPPIADLVARGYAVAVMYPGDAVADDAALAPDALRRLAADPANPPGAIAAWAWLFSRAIDALAADPRIDAARIAVWGHSRHGKAALLAGAFDARIAAVIAHQSGRGGASLTRSTVGESVAQVTQSFPHWFSPRFATLADKGYPVDQHLLLALIAPRPILLGNGDRDAWSDPESAFRAAQAASEVYRLFGAEGLTQAALRDNSISGDIGYFLRGGFHGVNSEDWRLFTAFLDAHVGGAAQQN